MFAYYAAYGLIGNPQILGWLLGRPPTSLESFVNETMARQAGEQQEGEQQASDS